MKKLIVIGLILLSSSCFAKKYEIRSKYIDIEPGDGLMDQGTSLNPYIIENELGDEVGTIRAKYMDIDPDDGFMDAGSRLNPYVIEEE